MYWLAPQEIEDLHPFFDSKAAGIAGGLYTQGDGHVDPSSVTQVFAKKARENGGQIFRFHDVTRVTQLANGRWLVGGQSQEGPFEIKCDFVVNAAGLWCDRIGALAGVSTPSVVIQHQYVITEAIPQLKDVHAQLGSQLPVLRDLEGSFYMRDEGDGFLIGPYEEAPQLAPAEWRSKGMPKEHFNFLFSSDMDRLLDNVGRAGEIVPILGETGLKTVLNGPTMWTADGNHLYGPSWEKSNYWLACAESYGIAHSAGNSRYLAHWIAKGEPPYELFESDPARYGYWATTDFVSEKVLETYKLNNHPHSPNENLTAARPVKGFPNEPLRERLRDNGAQFGFHNGWEAASWFHTQKKELGNSQASFRRPAYFSRVAEEVAQVSQKGGVIFWAFGKFMVEGPDALPFLKNLLCTRVPTTPGKCALGYMLTPEGKVLSEVMVSCYAPDKYYLVTYGEREQHDLRWMKLHQGEHQVSFQNVTNDYGVLMVNGPQSRSVLQKLSGHDFSRDAFKFYTFKEIQIFGVPLTAARVTYTGELGWELHVSHNHLLTIYDALKKEGLADFGAYAMGSFRLERAVKAFGSDMTLDHLGVEAGISMANREFMGKTVKDPTRFLAYLKVHSQEVDCVGNEGIWADNELVGFTTSGGFGHVTQTSLAFGYLPISYRLAKNLEVNLLGKRVPVEVLEKPVLPAQILSDKA
jgi:dimethylglycine dehydrogenase